MKQLIAAMIFMILMPVSLALNLTCTYTYYTTPNYRSSVLAPLSTLTSNSWVITYLTYPSGWNPYSLSSYLLFTGTGNSGVSAEFRIANAGYYTIELQLNNGQVTETNTSLWFNSSVITVANVLNLNMFKFMRNLTPQSYTLFIWLENLVVLNSLKIYSTTSYRPTKINLRHYPSQKLLLLITDIPVLSVSNLSILQSSKILLKYRTSFSSNCFSSINAPVNPQNYCNYTSTTDFTSISSGYTITSANSNATLMSGLAPGMLVLAVSNILIDCTVDVQVSLTQGKVLTDGYWNVFNVAVNQTAQFVEQYINLTALASYVVYFEPVQTIIYYDLNGFMNPMWSFQGVYFTIKANSITCNKNWTYISPTTINMCCINADGTVSTPPFVTTPSTTELLRDRSTNKLINLTIAPTVPQPHGYVIERPCLAYKNYYVPNNLLQIVYNITIDDAWRTSLTNDKIVIFVNGNRLPITDISVIPNTIKITAWVSLIYLTSSDVVEVGIDTKWQLNSIEGYHYQWTFNTQTSVTFIYSSMPGYAYSGSTSTSVPSINVGNSTYAPNFNSSSLPSQTAGQSFNASSLSPYPSSSNTTALEKKTSLIIDPHIIFSIIKFAKYYTKTWGFLLFNYFINTLINFQTLTFMYYFINFKNGNLENKKAVADAMMLIQEQTSYIYIFNSIFKTNVDFGVTEVSNDKIQGLPQGHNVLIYNDYGINSDFFRNNADGLLQIIISVVKILLVRFIVSLPFPSFKNLFKGLIQIWDQLLLIQIVMMAPSSTIVLGIYFAHNNYFQAINFFDLLSNSLLIMSSFIALTFMMWKHFIRVSRTKQKYAQSCRSNGRLEKLNKFELRKMRHLQNFRLFDNSMFMVIPLLIGFNVNSVFVLVTFVALLYRLITLINSRKYYSSFKLVKVLISKLLWVAFTSIYGLYWLTEIFEVNCSSQTWLQVMIICDFTQVLLLLAGCLIEILFTLIQIAYGIVSFVRQLDADQPGSNQISLAPLKQAGANLSKTAKSIMVKAPQNYFDQHKQSLYKTGHIATNIDLKKIDNFLVKTKSLRR